MLQGARDRLANLTGPLSLLLFHSSSLPLGFGLDAQTTLCPCCPAMCVRCSAGPSVCYSRSHPQKSTRMCLSVRFPSSHLTAATQ